MLRASDRKDQFGMHGSGAEGPPQMCKQSLLCCRLHNKHIWHLQAHAWLIVTGRTGR